MNSRITFGVILLGICSAVIGAPRPAGAQFSINLQSSKKSAPVERVATGKVVDKSGAAIGGAVVYMKNSHTNAVRTYIADNDGQFRFGELSQETDYVIWAESNGVRSKSHQISSFDSGNTFYFTLKVDAPKSISLD